MTGLLRDIAFALNIPDN
ncbi:methyl-accepting chemotaxis (MCP) signaling domain protein, partial [Vibrio parahaemolyticus V-223/04]